MQELTWVGWIFFINMVLGIGLLLDRGFQGKTNTTGPTESIVSACLCVLYVVGLLTVGFTR